MYEANVIANPVQETINEENTYKMINSWSNNQSNSKLNNITNNILNDFNTNETFDQWSYKPQQCLSKPSEQLFNRTELNDLTNSNYVYNNSNVPINYNPYYNQSYQVKQQQNYYGLPSAPAVNQQFNYQQNYDINRTSLVRNESDESNNTSRTSPLEQTSVDKLNITPVSTDYNETCDKVNNNNSYDSNKENNDANNSNVNNIPAFFTTQKMVSSAVKLSYTAYQLELLNAIYMDMRYPNSVQKTLIAKLIGITRDQVKIWFQNRRRKATLVSQGKIPDQVTNKTDSKKRRRSSDDSENNDEDNFPSSPENGAHHKQVVENQVIHGVLSQLRAHQNAPSRLSSKRTKTNNLEQNDDLVKAKNKSEELNSQARIIDMGTILNAKPQQENVYTANKLNTIEPVNKVAKIDYIAPSSSISSFSSSSTSSSSSEEEHPYNKYQMLQQPFSIKKYIDNRYMASYYKQPKVHNQYQMNQQPQVYNSSTQLNSWATIPQINYNQIPVMPTSTTDAFPVQTENVHSVYNNQNAYQAGSYDMNYVPKYQQSTQNDIFAQHANQPSYQFLTNNNTFNFCA